MFFVELRLRRYWNDRQVTPIMISQHCITQTCDTLDGNHAFVADKIMTYIQQKAIKIPSICVSQNLKMMIMFC